MTLSDLMKILTAKEEREIDFSWGEGWVGIKGRTEMGLEDWAGFGDGVLVRRLACGSQCVEQSEPSMWNRVSPGLARKPSSVAVP